MEKAILNLDILNITQGMNNSFSHKGNLAIDVTGCSYLKAPFTGIIKRIYPDCNTVWLESLEKIEYADGSIDYMTVMTLHDNDISNLYVGKIIKQGEIYYHQGTKGYVTGPHIQISVGRGKYIGSGWYKNKYGSWCINNQYDITKALYLSSNTKIVNGLYNWNKDYNKTIEQLAYEVIEGKWGNNPLRKEKLTRSGYNYQAVQNRVNEILMKKDTIYIVEKGDYLIKIGKKLNKDWEKIANDNNIKDPYIIYPGQKLIIK